MVGALTRKQYNSICLRYTKVGGCLSTWFMITFQKTASILEQTLFRESGQDDTVRALAHEPCDFRDGSTMTEMLPEVPNMVFMEMSLLDWKLRDLLFHLFQLENSTTLTVQTYLPNIPSSLLKKKKNPVFTSDNLVLSFCITLKETSLDCITILSNNNSWLVCHLWKTKLTILIFFMLWYTNDWI